MTQQKDFFPRERFHKGNRIIATCELTKDQMGQIGIDLWPVHTSA
jgi:hypothetical protein